MAHKLPEPRYHLEPDELSSLWFACCSNDTSPLAQLIETLDPSAHDLHPGLVAAVERSRLDMIRYLLELGVSIDRNIVHVALKAGSIPVLDLLREFGWDVNMRLGPTGTALGSAIHDISVVSYLLKLGADPNLGPGMGPCIGHPRRHHQVPTSGAILQAAASFGTIELFDMLIAHGAVFANAAALHAAVQSGSIEMMAHVLELGANVNERDSPETMGWGFCGTPLLRAITMGRIDLVKFLLERGADARVHGRDWNTALDLVRKEGVTAELTELIETAVEKQERENGPGQSDGTTLLKAVEMGDIDFAKFLIERSMNTTMQGGDWDSTLDLIRTKDISAELRRLIETAVEKQEKDIEGRAYKASVERLRGIEHGKANDV